MTRRDQQPRSRVESRAGVRPEHAPRLGMVHCIVILASLIAFVVAGLAIPTNELGDVDGGNRAVTAAVIAVAAFVVAVVTFALGALRRSA